MAGSQAIDKSIDSGAELIQRLMANGMAIEAAFWSKRPSGEARLNIVSSDIPKDGPRAVLRKIAEGLSKMNGSSTFELFDVDIASPKKPEVLELFAALNLSNVQRIRFSQHLTEGMFLEDLYIYFANLQEQLA